LNDVFVPYIFICVRFITTPLNIVDLMSILPTWLTLAFKDNEAMHGTAKVLRVCRPPSFLSLLPHRTSTLLHNLIFTIWCAIAHLTIFVSCVRELIPRTRSHYSYVRTHSLYLPLPSTPMLTNMRAPQVLRIMRIFKLARHNAGLLVKFIFRLA
jgi:hypothetical protein